MIDAANTSEEQVGPLVRAVLGDNADVAVRIAEGDELVAQKLQTDRWCIRRRNFGRLERRQPVAPRQVVHGRTPTGSRESFVLFSSPH
jgi:hypothetical protein